MSLYERAIDLSFTLVKPAPGDTTVAPYVRDQTGQFGTTGQNTLTVSGLRVSATISHAGSVGQSTADITVWGLPPAIMNQLSSLAVPMPARSKNLVTLSAGSVQEGLFTAFSGVILSSYVDGAAMPDVGLRLNAMAAAFDLVAAGTSTSTSAPQSAALIIAGIAAKAAAKVNNYGVTAILPPSYFSGSYLEQAQAAAAHANASLFVDEEGVWNIYPAGSLTNSLPLPIISAATGMVGLPAWQDSGMSITTLYNPTISFNQKIEVQSAVSARCNGVWRVYNVTHQIESQTQNGKWFSQLQVVADGQPIPTT